MSNDFVKGIQHCPGLCCMFVVKYSSETFQESNHFCIVWPEESTPLVPLAHISHLLAVISRRALIASGLHCRIALEINIFLFLVYFFYLPVFLYALNSWERMNIHIYMVCC